MKATLSKAKEQSSSAPGGTVFIREEERALQVASYTWNEKNAAFIAAARTAMPLLLDVAEAAKAVVATKNGCPKCDIDDPAFDTHVDEEKLLSLENALRKLEGGNVDQR